MTPTGFEEDVNKNELLRIHRDENRLPTIYEEDEPESDGNKFDEALTELYKVLAPGLIKKYFGKDSLREMAKQLKNI